MNNILFSIAQLRHLYAQLLSESINNQASAAKGLLGPAIETLEQEIEKINKSNILSLISNVQTMRKNCSPMPWRIIEDHTHSRAYDLYDADLNLIGWLCRDSAHYDANLILAMNELMDKLSNILSNVQLDDNEKRKI